MFKYLHNTDQEDQEQLQDTFNYYFGLKNSHSDFKPTFKLQRVSGIGYIDDNNAALQETLPSMRALMEHLSETDEKSIHKNDENAARTFLSQLYFSINCSYYSLVPKGEGDDKLVKQSMLDIVKLDPVMTKVLLRFYRTCLASDVANYMKRLVAIKPEVISNTDAIDKHYFDDMFNQRHYNRKNFSLKF
jgi:hypothetical protein